MATKRLVLSVMAFALGLTESRAAGPKVAISGTGIVYDAAPNRVRSDGRETYVDGEQCVHVGITTNSGFYQLRTVSASTPGCMDQTWGVRRTLTLDFGSPVPDLDLGRNDPDGDTIEHVPARLIADRLFSSTAATTPVKILIQKVDPVDGSTSADTAWELRYLNEAAILVVGNAREIVLDGAGDDDAELLEYVSQTGRKVRAISHGTFDMPLHLIAAPK